MRCRSLILLLALSLGCGATRSADPVGSPSPPPPTTTYLVKETKLVNGAVEVRMEIPPQPAGRKPAVIALLGDTHAVLAAGFVAVTYTVRWGLLRAPEPTPAPSAQVVGKWVLASPSESVLGERYLRDIATTADTFVPAVLDWVVQQPEVDPVRLAFVGSSTNGFIALRAGAVDQRLGVVVAIAACADYQRFLQGSAMGMSGQPLHLAPSYAEWLRTQEVIRDPAALTHAAVLMVNRSADPLIPVACADETARVLSEAFASAGVPERFRYDRLEGEGHGLGDPEAQATMAWLNKWLRGGG